MTDKAAVVALTLCALTLCGTAATARSLPPAPWIDIAPGQRLSVVLDGPDRSRPFVLPDRGFLLASGLVGLRQSLHRRVGSAMFDFYPARRLPLRLSGGAFAIGRRDLLSNSEWREIGWRSGPDAGRPDYAPGGVGMLAMPTATAGYQHGGDRGMLFGVEGGAMLSHAPGLRPGDRRAMLDPVVAVYLAAAL